MTAGNGVDLKRWTLPEELIKHHSPFLFGVLYGSTAGADATIINIPDVDPTSFGSYVRWIYTGKVGDDSGAIALAQAWVLGGKLGCSAFSDKALLELLDFHKDSSIRVEMIQFSYSNTPKGSKLRKWSRQQFLYGASRRMWSDVDDSKLEKLAELDGWCVTLMRELTSFRDRRVFDPCLRPEGYMEALDSETAMSLQRRKPSESRHSRSRTTHDSPARSPSPQRSDSTASRIRSCDRSFAYLGYSHGSL